MSRSILLPIAFLAVSLATAQTPDWSRCANVIPIPGNADGVTSCAVCNNGAQTYYPCDDPSLCYCNGTTIPPQYLLPFSPCSVVAAVRGNPDGLSNASCAVCDGGNYRWYPCEAASVGILCYCAVGSVLSSAATTAVPATSAPTTRAPTTKTPTTRAPTTGTPTNASATTSAPTSTLAPTAAPTTTNASTTTTTTSTTGAPLTSTTTAATSAAPTTGTTTTTSTTTRAPATPAPTAVPTTTTAAPTTSTTAATTTTTRAPTTPAPTAVPTTTTACVEPSLGDPTNPSSPISVATRASPVYGQTTGPNVDRVKRLLNASFFASLFPLANLGLGLGQGPYTYDAFVAAIGHFPDLCNSVGPLRSGLSLDEVCRMELATMFAHFVQETGDFDDSLSIPIWKQGLYWYEELGCSVNTAGCDYTSADPNFPPVPGKKYYGRGPFQLSYNYNYGPFSLSVYGDSSVLLNHPEYVVSTDPNYSWLAFASALWFYMTPQPPKPSMHDIVAGHWVPSATDVAQGRTSSFGSTIMVINGGVECGGGAPPRSRGVAFLGFSSALQVQPSSVTAFSPVDCGQMDQFTTTDSTLPMMYWGQDWSTNCACMFVEWYSGYSLVATANLSVGYAMCVNSLPGCSCQLSSPSASPAANSPPAAAGALATLKGAAQGSTPTLQSPSRGRGTATSIAAGVALAVGVAVACVVGLYKGGWLTGKRRDAYAKPTEGIELPEVADIPTSAVAAAKFAAEVSCDA